VSKNYAEAKKLLWRHPEAVMAKIFSSAEHPGEEEPVKERIRREYPVCAFVCPLGIFVW
jgi:hypothetical protein